MRGAVPAESNRRFKMGAMKAYYTASRDYDRDTGASLCPRPRWRQQDMQAPRPVDPGVSRGARDRLARARGLVEQHRGGTVSSVGDGKYWFIVDSTREYRTGRGTRYRGWIEMRDGRLVDGECDCPDEGDYLRGFMVCKHRMWAALKVQAGDFVDRVPVTLTIGWDEEHGCLAVVGVKDGIDPVRPPKPDETLVGMRRALKRHGYRLEGAFIKRDRTIDEVYA
jgi:hypothetical protein